MSDKSRAVVAHMATSIAAISSASASAEALLNQTSSHIRDITQNVDSSNQDDVDQCLDQLESFADQLDQQAAELGAAVEANTPAATDGSAPASSGDSSADQQPGDGTVDPHTIEGAAAAGGYSTTTSAPVTEEVPLPPAAGQHPDAENEQPQNSTLTELGEGTTGDETKDDTSNQTDQSAGSGSSDQTASGEGQQASGAEAEASSAENNDVA